MLVKVKKVHSEAKLPVRNNITDAGADLCSVENLSIPPQSRALVSTGISIQLPSENVYGRIAPRSGLAFKNGIDVLAGVIDNGYTGTIGVVLINTDKEKSFDIKIGDRIAQLIIETYHQCVFSETDNLEETSRSDKGFGSSGIK